MKRDRRTRLRVDVRRESALTVEAVFAEQMVPDLIDEAMTAPIKQPGL